MPLKKASQKGLSRMPFCQTRGLPHEPRCDKRALGNKRLSLKTSQSR